MEVFFLKIALSALLLSLLLALYSFIVYFFRLAFLGIAVSHAVLGGLAVGVFFHVDPTLTALLFSLPVGWAVAFLRRKTGLTEDASIGMVLALSMAVGIILIYLGGYEGNIFAYLFGSLTTVTWWDNGVLALLVVISTFFFWRYKERILFLCFDEETAYSSGVNTSLLYYTLVGFLSFLITYLTKLVGVLLTHAMLVLPTAAAYQIFWHYPELLISGFFISATSIAGGLVAAYIFDLPTGPAVVIVGGLLFGVLSLFGRLMRKAKSLSEPPSQ